MYTRKFGAFFAFAFGVVTIASGLAAAETHAGFGTPATAAAIQYWNVEIPPSGENLPSGSGSVAVGEKLYATQCAACHGTSGQGGPMDKLVGGRGTLGTAKPIKTVGSYWPYATTLFDYVRRAMPFDRPGTLKNDEVYAVTAYVLYLNDIVPANATLRAATLPHVRMPNRDDFILEDPRPDAP